ncbi:low temperature requirement protein A [soil metagenome]
MSTLYTPMLGRDAGEAHRASTPLELLVDLSFVVAVARAAAGLHHQLMEAHVGAGIAAYLVVFFAIWWAWMNFSWFASSFDTDDVPYRLLTLVQMFGVLVLASGVDAAFDGHYGTVAIGFLILRIGLIGQYVRLASSAPQRRSMAITFAAGLAVLQVGWMSRLLIDGPMAAIALGALVLAELAFPRLVNVGAAPIWHPEHIAERFGLFTIIVLGECLLAVANAVQEGVAERGVTASLAVLAGGSMLVLFGVWWRYFDFPAEEALRADPRLSYWWSYGHYAVFASVAAMGAGLEVVAGGMSHVDLTEGAVVATVAVPLMVFLVVTSLLHRHTGTGSLPSIVRTATALVALGLVVAAAPLLGVPGSIGALGLVVAAGVTASFFEAARTPGGTPT